PKGRIKCLFDRDGDGVFDEAKVFLDDLVQPTGVTVWRDGVLVCSAPDVLFAADHDGDGVADERRVLLHGFATHNAQARVNSLTFGLDGFLYGAGGLFGGQIEVPANGSKQNLDSRDFRFDPDHGVLQSATGRAQYGRPRDDWGAWFGCHSTGFLQHYPLGDHYLARNADVPPPPFEVDASGPDGGRVLPISAQPERFNDLELLGRTTAACGATIYRDQWLGAQYAGNAFCCDPVSNVVHRIELTADGVTFAGRRPAGDSDREFLASTDFWFRPVQAVTGPDGALWVVDIARFVVEHPVFIAPQRLQQLDVRAGEHLGRIWRVLPAGAASKPLPDLLHLDNPGLVRLLAAANGALRDRAHELLLWRAAVDVAPQLEALARGGERATARLHALCVLDGLRALAPGLLLQALSDPEPGVRAHAVRLCESRLAGAPELLPAVLQLCADADAKVRLQVACSLGESRDQRVGAALAGMLRRDGGDPWLRAAALSSARPHAFALATSLYSATELPLADRFELLALLLSMLPPVVARVAGEDLAAAFTAARASLAGDGEPAERLAAVQLLRRSRSGPDRAALVAAFAPAAPADLLSALAAVLATIDDAALPDRLLADWNSQGPEFHAAVLDLLCQRRSFCLRLLEVAASTPAVRQSIDASHRQLLQQHADATVRERAGAVLTAASAGRVTVLAQYGGLDSRRGDPTLGAQVFAATCTACHRL
ncbi:MAG TPA: PVC-type heme-binding CxxCH protein, partial [Planctomycetota bacterium]|nr:PVC-type heme-binding CxxCH protein [Planctomycetota bacterium]